MLPLFSSISTCLGGFFSPSISQGRVLGALSEGLGCWHLLKFSPDKCYYLEILIFLICVKILGNCYITLPLCLHTSIFNLFSKNILFKKYTSLSIVLEKSPTPRKLDNPIKILAQSLKLSTKLKETQFFPALFTLLLMLYYISWRIKM